MSGRQKTTGYAMRFDVQAGQEWHQGENAAEDTECTELTMQAPPWPWPSDPVETMKPGLRMRQSMRNPGFPTQARQRSERIRSQ